jgi:hypothetical protein
MNRLILPLVALAPLLASAKGDREDWQRLSAISDEQQRVSEKLNVLHVDLIHLCDWASGGGPYRMPTQKDLDRTVAAWAKDQGLVKGADTWNDRSTLDEKLNHLHAEAERCKDWLLRERSRRFPKSRAENRSP